VIEELKAIEGLTSTIYVKVSKHGKLVDGLRTDFAFFADIVAKNVDNPVITTHIASAPVKRGTIDRTTADQARIIANVMITRGIEPVIVSTEPSVLGSIKGRIPGAESGLLVRDDLYGIANYPRWRGLDNLGCRHVFYEPNEPVGRMHISALIKLAKSGQEKSFSAWINLEDTNIETVVNIASGGMGVIIPTRTI